MFICDCYPEWGGPDPNLVGFQPMEDAEKEKLYQQQKLINAKRKAHQKLERLELALKRKKLQMVSYQDQIKKQLATEMQRF